MQCILQMGAVMQALVQSYLQPSAALSASSSASSLDLVSWADNPAGYQRSFSFPAAAYQEPWPGVCCLCVHSMLQLPTHLQGPVGSCLVCSAQTMSSRVCNGPPASGTLYMLELRFLPPGGMLWHAGQVWLLDAQRQANHAACVTPAAMLAYHDMQRLCQRAKCPQLCACTVAATPAALACKAESGHVQRPLSIHAPTCTTTPSSPARARKLAAGPSQKLLDPRQLPPTHLLSSPLWSHTPCSQLLYGLPMPTASCGAEAAQGSSSRQPGLSPPHLLPSSLRHPPCPPRLPCGTPPAQRVPPGGHGPPGQARTLR